MDVAPHVKWEEQGRAVFWHSLCLQIPNSFYDSRMFSKALGDNQHFVSGQLKSTKAQVKSRQIFIVPSGVDGHT